MRYLQVGVISVLIAFAAGCTTEDDPAPDSTTTNASTSAVRLTLPTATKYSEGERNNLPLIVNNSGPARASVDIELEFKLSGDSQSDLIVDYQRTGSDDWRKLTLTKKSDSSVQGSYSTSLPKGNTTLRLRMTLGSRPKTEGEAIPITATLRSGKEELSTVDGEAPLATLTVKADPRSTTLDQGGSWSEFHFEITNESLMNYPEVAVQAFEECTNGTGGECGDSRGSSEKVFRTQWLDGSEWKDLRTFVRGPASNPGYPENEAIEIVNLALPPNSSREVRMRISTTAALKATDGEGEILLTAEGKGTGSTKKSLGSVLSDFSIE
ncbi:hypothetical protein [Streptomyces tauricus]|uniref:hypothetical protein n=1 Tax=Streptomyces tauricus TaxID=68274 RepID=UPI0022449FA2|nr:hypothetical protein [Streptomyces tauricus]MCW8097334.1 hypothetical protein [Streptomyces tauricus]